MEQYQYSWQEGLRGQKIPRESPNGSFVESIIRAAILRLEFYQKSKFGCNENKFALLHLHAAIKSLKERTKKREAAGIEGTHAI